MFSSRVTVAIRSHRTFSNALHSLMWTCRPCASPFRNLCDMFVWVVFKGHLIASAKLGGIYAVRLLYVWCVRWKLLLWCGCDLPTIVHVELRTLLLYIDIISSLRGSNIIRMTSPVLNWLFVHGFCAVYSCRLLNTIPCIILYIIAHYICTPLYTLHIPSCWHETFVWYVAIIK